MIALRFSGGVEAGAHKGEELRVDATLEQEAANIKATTLHGGRAASAMQSTLGGSEAKPGIASLATSSMKQPSAGEAPKRLI